MQDLVRETMKPGKSGDQVLVETRAKMAKEGIDGLVYSTLLPIPSLPHLLFSPSFVPSQVTQLGTGVIRPGR